MTDVATDPTDLGFTAVNSVRQAWRVRRARKTGREWAARLSGGA